MNSIVARKKRDIDRLKKEIVRIKKNALSQIHYKQKQVLRLTQEIESLQVRS